MNINAQPIFTVEYVESVPIFSRIYTKSLLQNLSDEYHTTKIGKMENIHVDLNVNDVSSTDIFTPYIKNDMEVVRNWVRRDLFDVVKFLYNGPNEDLARGSKIYNFFVNHFLKHDSLVGLKAVESNPTLFDRDKKLYLDRLWTDSIAEQVVVDGLSYRRSAVYSVMNNKFRGKALVLTVVCSIAKTSYTNILALQRPLQNVRHP